MKVHIAYFIGVIDNYGASFVGWPILKDENSQLSQPYPGHYYIRNRLFHKKWRWLVPENRLDRSALLDWEPDAEELDLIERQVKKSLEWYNEERLNRIPRYSLDGIYPNWKQITL